MIRILIADDHGILRAGLKHILSDCMDIEVAGEACDGHETLAQVRAGTWDTLVLDLSMPGRSGIELIKQIKGEFPKLPILILSMHKEDIYAVRTLKAGASGYLCKDNAETQLADAIRKVASGGLFINSAVAEKLTREMLSGG
ncbi:MAG: response regulator, partial [Azovibrio sp.]